MLMDLAKRQKLEQKINSMFQGERINKSENRSVLHVATRANIGDPPIMVDGVNVVRERSKAIREAHISL
jgi:glucose-6-phosphate isomerase